MTESSDTNPSRPRLELGEFLKKKRAALKRSDFGIESAGPIRSKGLRREDVAYLTHVSLSWYTWLEQGKDISVSARFLSRLADALRLDEAERRYLFRLCGQQAPQGRPLPDGAGASPQLVRLLGAIRGAAFVIDRRWDVVAANRYAEALFGIRLPVQAQPPNVMRLLFLDGAHRALMPDWESDARKAVAKFRLDVREAAMPELEAMVAELRGLSAEFDAFWREAAVASRTEDRRVFRHPAVGELRLGYTLLDVAGRPDLRLNVYVPEDESSVQGLDRLVEIGSAGR
ncbi:helix-turn-helix transcriptional regulator [Ottowia sp.]|uniref:helix-turn-helix transcriptional regulator n=1 Tax=Ottowia sp. TaxID=1898956 RepID=UPI0039E605E9